MSTALPFAQCVTLTTNWCVLSAYRLAAAAHVQREFLSEAQILAIENVALEHGRAASQRLPEQVLGGEKDDAIDRGVAAARDLFATLRRQRLCC